MTTIIKAKLRKSDDQTNIDKYRVAAKITGYHINLPKNHHTKIHDCKSIISCEKSICLKWIGQ